MKRPVDIAVISDVHLGTYGCKATELLNYIKSIKPEILVLNGDIIDIWNIKKRFFPIEHLQIIQHILKMSLHGTRVYYITGNHDDTLRQFSDFSSGEIHLRNELVLYSGKKRYLIFHGDQFDKQLQLSRLLAVLGGKSYDLLIKFNTWTNRYLKYFGAKEISFAHAVKKGFKRAMQFIHDFEQKAISHAASKGFDGVICGHIHIPQDRLAATEFGSIHYLNSGDWVENMTALEYNNNAWNTYKYESKHFPKVNKEASSKAFNKKNRTGFFKSKQNDYAEQNAIQLHTQKSLNL